MTRVATLKYRRVLLLTGLAWLACLVVGVSIAAAATPPGTVPNLASPSHPSQTIWYSSANPSFTWGAATAGSSPIAGYSFVLDQNPNTSPSTAGGTGANSYQTQVPYTVGSGPTEDRVADLTGNGVQDIIVENAAANTVSVLMGNGDGTFKAAVNYATGTDPWSMDIGDVNGDGHVDIVTCNNTANSVSVLLGNGDGTFQTAIDYSTGDNTSPEAVRLGDVSGDGKLDIVTANASTSANNISVLMNNGNGTFASPVTFGTATHPTSIAFGDLNGDGKLDIVTANYTSNNVSVLMGNGNGTFKSAVNYDCGVGPQTVVVADLNGDGKPDVATVNYGPSNASVLLNTGTGALAGHVDYTVGAGPYALSVADMNHDGALDLVSTNHNANTVSILYGNGNGTFQTKVDLATGPGPFWVALGDFNGSGYTDLAATNQTNGTVSVLIGSEYFRPASSTLAASFTGKADGIWYFHVRAVDTNGLGSTTPARYTVLIDTKPPVTTQTGADSAWHKTPVTVSFAVTDAGSGPGSTQYSTDGGNNWTTGSSVQIPAPANGSNDGVHTIQYRSTDAAGNQEIAKSCAVKIDATAPLTTQTGADSAWHKTPVTVSFATTDAGSGQPTTQYSTDGGNNWTTGTSLTIPAPAGGANDGSHAIQYRSTDAAGNRETAKTCTVNIDTTPPTTTASGSDSAWSNTPVTVTLTPSDAGSGPASTQYSTDGGNNWTTGTSVTIPAPAGGSNDGSHAVLYRSTDLLGNQELAKTRLVNISTQAPTTTVSGADSAWHDGPVTLTFSASGAGTVTTQYSTDNGVTWTTGTSLTFPAPLDGSDDGSHIVLYRSTDAAGNLEALKSATVNIDAAPPTTSVSGLDSAWSNGPVTLTFSATDIGSGPASTQYSTDNGTTWTTGTSVTIPAPSDGSGDGLHTVLYGSTDNFGHVETPKSCTVGIDTTAPTTTQSGADMAWHSSDVTVSFTGSDGSGSGVAYTQYRVDGGAWTRGTSVVVPAPSNGDNDGVHAVDYRSTDIAGNLGSVQGCVVKIDTNGPVTVDNAAGVWHEVPFTLLLSATNKSTADTTTQYSLGDDQHWQTGSTLAFGGWKRGGGSGLYTVYYRSTDAAGVIEATRSTTVMLDATRPVTTDDAPRGPQAADVTVHLTATDTFSGVFQTWYQVDGGAWLVGTSVLVPATADHANDGLHTIKYFSVDNAGNSEAGYRVCTVLIATP
jgi:hypothetical protein